MSENNGMWSRSELRRAPLPVQEPRYDDSRNGGGLGRPWEGGGRSMKFHFENLNNEMGDSSTEIALADLNVKAAVEL